MEVDTLPYDDEAGNKLAEEEAYSLQNRISKARLYLLADSSASIHARLLTKVRPLLSHTLPSFSTMQDSNCLRVYVPPGKIYIYSRPASARAKMMKT